MFEILEVKDVKREIGQLVRLVRKKRKLSQVQLAALLDVSRTTIQNLESGKNFTADTLLKILKEFDLLDQLNHEIILVKDQIVKTKSLY